MTHVLGTARVVLDAWRDGDAEALAALGNDRETARQLSSLPHPFTPAEAAARIAASRASPGPAFRAPLRLAGGRLIGEGGISPGAEPTLMVWLGAEWRGRGLGRAALSALLARAFADPGRAAVTAECFLDNAPSIALLTRAGFAPTGEAVAEGHALRPGPARYRRFRLARSDWEAGA